MRLLGKVAIGTGALSAVTAGALVVGGVFATSATLVAVDPGARPAQADSLTTFDSCDQLLDWYVDHTIDDVGPYGWGGPIMYAENLATADLRAGFAVPQAASPLAGKSLDTTANARGSSSTGTNTQEVDVDEPDVAKTDGTLLVRLTRPHGRNPEQVLKVSDVTGAESVLLGMLYLPDASYDSQLLLVGTHVVLTQSVSGYGNPVAYDTLPGRFGPMSAASTRVLDIDISDPAHPRLVGTDVYSGSLISARQYGDTVRLVTDTGRPELKWKHPGRWISTRHATEYNRKLVRDSTIEDWLPTVKHAGQKARLLDCSEVMHPKVWSGNDTIAVTTFKAGAPAERKTVGITAAGGVVYSSVDRLYVASTEWQRRGWGADVRIKAPDHVATDLHVFKLDGLETSYVASGHLDGMIRDRWSLDEYDGNLRVAWGSTDKHGKAQNGVSVFSERDHRLVEVGHLDGLGVNEDIQSVRWFDDLAIVVTFRQVDPLYTVDLSDPNNPRKRGELKIPGYSGYLHPIGDNLLLGLGVDGNGWDGGSGGQAAVFDISDVTKPVRLSKTGFGRTSHLQALEDPRAFTWLPSMQTGLTVVADWGVMRTYEDEQRQRYPFRVDALKVGPGGETDSRTVARLPRGWQPRILPLGDDRVAIIDSYLVQLVDLG